ncbi:MAG: thermonuclease family protein [Actinomycetota bacterium]|nr:thermonuclease family protein [Actinomycetota bacterium]
MIKVIDGDTVDVRLNASKRKVRVRLIGIDTPEVYGGRECWGPQASKAGKQVLPRGTRVTLTSDRSQALKDRYGRLLRYIKKDSNRADFGKVQLRRGNAHVYVYGGKPFVRVKSYKRSQAAAKRADRGLWGNC